MKILSVIFLILAGCSVSCNRKDFLNERPSSDLVVPTTVDDFQALLDNDIVTRETPILGELSSDNYYLQYSVWQGLKVKERNAYIWAKIIFDESGLVADWNRSYEQVFYANVVLENIDKVTIKANEQIKYNLVKGSAYFLRGYAFYNLAQVFAPVYDSQDANQSLGVPLRTKAGIEVKVGRSTVQETYDQIIKDLKEAIVYLPNTVNGDNLNRPCKPAALALLARVYLSMRMYDKAAEYADLSLGLYSNLIDYNTVVLPPIGNPPFARKNLETMYQSVFNLGTNVLVPFYSPNCIVDSNLYKSYHVNDLRRTIFFTTTNPVNPRYNYSSTINMFSGLATDEVYLIRAEAFVRTGRVSAGINDLNKLLQNRYKTGTFTPYSTSLTQDQALGIILTERRKELPFRGLRWTDLRRLNKEGANITLTRKLNGETYTLVPNDINYTLPIPPDVVRLGGIKDNDRRQ